jgi:uncharacterized protein (UPF0276 family)
MAMTCDATVTDREARLRVPASNQMARVGASFKHEHLADILADRATGAFFEVHAENYMGDGGPPHRALQAIRRDYPLSVHGVCMSIGAEQAIALDHLARFRRVIERYEPVLVSEHLAWSTHGNAFYNDLLPLPYTKSTLARVCDHVSQVQDAIGRTILLENPSTYLTFHSSTYAETDFLCEVAKQTGCGLLLDLNNVFVSAVNHGYTPGSYLNDFPLWAVGEIHLAGHSRQVDEAGEPLLIDSHDRAVSDEVWALYEQTLHRLGAVPTLIEWDSNLPSWPGLWSQVIAARERLERVMYVADGVAYAD